MIYSKPPRLIFLRLLLILLLAFPSPAFAATRTWSAAQADNWSNTLVWSGSAVPGATDLAVFDNTSVQNSTIDTAVGITSLNIASGYTGTITKGSYTVTLSGSLSIAGGHFLGGSSSIDINNNLYLSGGTFTATSETMFIAISSSFTPGTFIHNNGTIQFDSSQGTVVWVAGSGSYQNFSSGFLCALAFNKPFANFYLFSLSIFFQLHKLCLNRHYLSFFIFG